MYKHCPHCGVRLKSKRIERRLRNFCPSCRWVCYENPLPSAAAFVRNKKAEILLIQRGVEPGRGKWALPSGFIEVDETAENACLRELEEETGLKGEIRRLIGVYSQKSKLYKNVLIVAYEVKGRGSLLPGSDSLRAEYFRANNLPDIAFPSHARIIEDGIKKR
jgi:8-oxo-dGTP diphosphatase